MDDAATRGDSPSALAVEGMEKSFADVRVLHGVNLAVAPGEIHALLGPNGSGKSTLVKILAGYHEPSQYRKLEIGGVAVPKEYHPRSFGVRVVHQDAGLVPDLSVLENIALGSRYATGRAGLIRWPRTRSLAREALQRIGLNTPMDAEVGTLAAWEQVGVAIARAVSGALSEIRLLILDEVTAALPKEEVHRVSDVVQRLAASGVAVLFVTHRFEEVFEIAQRYTVFRDGRNLAEGDVADIDEDGLIELVAGRRIEPTGTAVSVGSNTAALLECESLNSPRLRGVSLTVGKGEILCVTGRAGSGKSALGRLLFGVEPGATGRVQLDGKALSVSAPAEAIAAGIGYLSQDRTGHGIVPGGSVAENLTYLRIGPLAGRLGLSSDRPLEELARRLVKEYGIVPADPSVPIEALSGGNQQKVLLARWMQMQPRLMVLDEPTEGIDAGARDDVYRIIRRTAQEGTSFLVLSSSIEEVAELADRVIVLADGSRIAELEGAEITPERVEELSLLGAGTTAGSPSSGKE